MQAASNFLQDKILGGPVEIDQAATPEYKHRADGSTMKALTWQVGSSSPPPFDR